MPAPKSPEFRRRAVELARLRQKPIGQIAKDLGIVEDPAGHRDRHPARGEFTDHRVDHFGRTFSRAK